MFRSGPLVSAEMATWITQCFDWFDARFQVPAKPVLPTRAFFRAPAGTGHTTALAILSDVKRLLGFTLPIDLVPLASLPPDLRHTYQSHSRTAGTYYEDEDGRVIHYDPVLMERPLSFINTMAHEVMHARLSGMEASVPGGAEAHELATDLGCIIAGFGVFQMQAADESGWSGYMTQQSRAYALAQFLDHRGLGHEAVASYLSGRCRKLLKRGLRDLSA